MAERQNEPPSRGVKRRSRFRVHRLSFNSRRLALERVNCKLMVGWERRMAGGQELDAEVPEIEGANTQRVPNPGQNWRGPRRLSG